MVKAIRYSDDPAEYERALRENLSRKTKAGLIDFGVNMAIEAERLADELTQIKAAARAELAGLPFANQVLPSLAFDEIVCTIREHFKNPRAADLLVKARQGTLKASGHKGGVAKRERDPYQKHAAIETLFQFWHTWQTSPDPKRMFKTQVQFAAAALDEIPSDRGGRPVIAESHLLKVLIPRWTKERAAFEK